MCYMHFDLEIIVIAEYLPHIKALEKIGAVYLGDCISRQTVELSIYSFDVGDG